MKLRDEVVVGLLLAIGSAQFIVVMMLGEAVAPGYSMHDNAISDLGVIGETRLFFNASLVTIGLFNFLAGYYFVRIHGDRRLMVVFFAAGVGAMGAGLVPLDSPLGIHGPFALLAFLFFNLEAILCARLVPNPLRTISVVAGAVGLVFLAVMVLVDSHVIDPSGTIGHGGVERMIAFPMLIWMTIFGGYLLQTPAPGAGPGTGQAAPS